MSHPRSVRTARFAAAILLPALTGACGYLLVDGPPDDYLRRDRVSCTSGDLGPASDMAIALVSTAGAVAIASTGDDGIVDARILAVPFGATALGYGSSGIVGFSKTHACREAREELQQREPRSVREDPLMDSGR